MLVELGGAEQRYRAVLKVLGEGASMIDVVRRCGVARQTAHHQLRRYANQGGLAGAGAAAGRIEVGAVADRLAAGAGRGAPLPGRSSVYRAMVRRSRVDWVVQLGRSHSQLGSLSWR